MKFGRLAAVAVMVATASFAGFVVGSAGNPADSTPQPVTRPHSDNHDGAVQLRWELKVR